MGTSPLDDGTLEETPDNQTEDERSDGISRRSLVLGVGGAAVMFGLGGLKLVNAQAITRPPGGQDEDHLISACIRCQRCYEICPRKVVAPAHFEDGLLNMRTPTLDFSDDYCDYCVKENGGDPLCVKVCSTGALRLPEGATVTNTVIGKAKIVKDWCLAYRMTGCRFCYDACPHEAIKLDENKRPVMIPEKCNGCGACEAVCVSLQNGSISAKMTARAITIHTTDES